LPDADADWLLPQLRRQHPEAGIIVLSDDGSALNILQALRAGADDFLNRDTDSPTLLERITQLLHKPHSDRSNARWRRRTAAHLKNMRRRRQKLAQQVQLVCRDLVGGYRRTVERLLVMQTVQACRTAVEGQLELKSLLAGVLRYLSETFGQASAVVFLAPFGSARMRLFTPDGGGPPDDIDQYDQSLLDGIVQRTLAKKRAIFGAFKYNLDQDDSADMGADSVADDSESQVEDTAVTSPRRHLLACGLHLRRKTIGAVVLQRKGDCPFTEHEADLLDGLSATIAAAIDLAQQFESKKTVNQNQPENKSE